MSQEPREVTTRTFHWMVQRSDGIGFATTSHDQVLVDGAVTFEPDADLNPSEMILTDQMFGSSLQLKGRLSTKSLTAADLKAGRWSGATVKFLAGDWFEQSGKVLLCDGELGRIAMEEGPLSLSVDLLPRAAKQPACIETSPECRAVLGDQQCRISMRSRRRRVQVNDVVSDGVVIDHVDNAAFNMGRLRWLSGADCGKEQRIIAAQGSRLILQRAEDQTVQIGDRAIIEEGCDGRRETCSERFANILNFRGEPDLPGSQIFLRLPGA